MIKSCLAPLNLCCLLALSTTLCTRPTVTEIPFVSGLSLPVDLVHAGDGSGRLFILELEGLIKVYKDGEILQEPFLDLTDRFSQTGERGLLGLAFHPGYSENGRFFVNYVLQDSIHFKTWVAEYKVSATNPDQASPTERLVLQFGQPTNIHNGGDLDFGPDGYLYISSGDGGPVADPDDRGQDLGSFLGKILRIDVDGDRPYQVPPNNPFVGQRGPGRKSGPMAFEILSGCPSVV